MHARRRVSLSVPLCACLLVTMISVPVRAQTSGTNEWAWMGGSVASESFGVYGTLGVAGSGNWPGSRDQPVTWTDNSGNLWLFGGSGFDQVGTSGYLNDLWEYNQSTGEWAWMGGDETLPSGVGVSPGVNGIQGTPGTSNIPAGRSGAVSWTDTKGNLWLFGGSSYSYTGLLSYWNDLWMYSPSARQWTWVSGSSAPNQSGVYGTVGTGAAANVPGGRQNALSWADSKGNLWLFGGAGYDSTGYQGNLNDLWKFVPATGLWTWVSGANTTNQVSVPGSKGTPASGNVPGARNQAVSWLDGAGNLWLFGGSDGLNDLWEYNPTTNLWVWISGDAVETSGKTEGGVYGSPQTPAPGNVPGARVGAVTWIDRKSNLWMFGGVGYDADNVDAYLNDLWQFNPSKGQWTWMSGSAENSIYCPILANWCGQIGVYGTLQVPSLATVPGGRYDAAGWSDAEGNFWLFGGIGLDANSIAGMQNDLWEFQPNTTATAVAATPDFSPGSGNYSAWQTVSITDTTPGATIQYMIDGNVPALYTSPLTISASETIEAIAFAKGVANSAIATASYTADLPAAAAPAFSVAPGNYPTSQTVSLSDATPGATIYYSVGELSTTPASPYTGPIVVSATETIQAIAVAPDYLKSPLATAAYNIGPSPSSTWTWMGGASRTGMFTCPNANGCGQAGWYGSLRVAAVSNIPGARFDAANWTDPAGHFWLFGGEGLDATGYLGGLNDLWEFDPSTSEWTWMAGDTTVLCPASDLCGRLGKYGSLGAPGVDNSPGSRYGAAAWKDRNGNLWLLGGVGYDSIGTYGDLNDLWEFSAAAKQWEWVGGSNTISCNYQCGAPGVYGRFQTPETGNMPGARADATRWTDANGHFWLFGGLGIDARGLQCYLNDLWEFDSTTARWAWMGGNKSCPNAAVSGWEGIYGPVGMFGTGFIPWSLQSPSAWTDLSGNLRLFGGIGVNTSGDGYYLNDMWAYDPASNQWAWTNANSASNRNSGLGSYGSLGVFTPSSIPGSRLEAASWIDGTGNFWLFGGSGVSRTTFGWQNDLWEFKPSINQWAWIGGDTGLFQSGTYGSLGTPASENLPGARLQSATWTDNAGNLWLFGGHGIDAQGTYGYLNDLWQVGLNGPPSVAPPQPTTTPVLSPASGSYSAIQQVSISDTAPNATIYYTTDGTYPNSTSSIYSGPITVSSPKTLEAIAVSSGFTVSPAATANYTITLSQASMPVFNVPAGTYTSSQTVSLSDTTTGATIYYTIDGTTPTSNSTVYSGPISVSRTEDHPGYRYGRGLFAITGCICRLHHHVRIYSQRNSGHCRARSNHSEYLRHLGDSDGRLYR